MDLVDYSKLNQDINMFTQYSAPFDMDVITHLVQIFTYIFEQYAPMLMQMIYSPHYHMTVSDTNTMLWTMVYVFGVFGFMGLFVAVNGGYTFYYSLYYCRLSLPRNDAKCVQKN